jgi:hypothetical protein
VLPQDAYTYEDHQADIMGNSPSSEGSPQPSPMDVDGPAGIHRVQGVTGAAKTDTKPKVRGPKADAADYPFVQASKGVIWLLAGLPGPCLRLQARAITP